MSSPGYVQMNLAVPAESKREFKRLCSEAGVSLSQAIQNYIDASRINGKLLATEVSMPYGLYQKMKAELKAEIIAELEADAVVELP